MASFYPIVLEPLGLDEISASTPPVPEQPKEPIKPEKKDETIIGSGSLLLCMFLFFILLFTDNLDGSGMLLPAALAVSGILYLIEKQVNRGRERSYEKALSQYPHIQAYYEEKLRQYNEATAQSLNSAAIEKYREHKRMELFMKASYLKKNAFTAKKGMAEQEFMNELLKYFPGQVIHGKSIGTSSFDVELQYQPDLILMEPESQLHIDIEIDEPYNLQDKLPIHYEGKESDTRRNSFFQKHGWLVVRFAEEQVEKYPKECCKYIAYLIREVTGNSKYLYLIGGSAVVPKVKVWTKEEAITMARNNYRNAYLYAASPDVGNKTLEEELKENGFHKRVNNLQNSEDVLRLMDIYKRHGVRLR